MELQDSFDHEGSVPPENVFIKDVITSETNVASNQPVKKPTRQWAAWTREEEESFFTALRQVGKNFEKITSRVQSKNKDQVRHYYYRLVRRMNKLLGPELSLDAKNSKDTNAAMLRWWSLLEKHSCKASKLHLKPRRFKIFLETLEHQLLKDRKKKRKRLPLAENCSITPSNVPNHGRASGHDARIKLVFVESQNIQKLGPGKGSSLRRNTVTGVDCNNCKGDPSLVKPARQRRKSGTASVAAYKRWEKAAIAGVSLVADAAEHLERTALDKLVDSVQDMQRDKGLDPLPKEMPHATAFQQNVFSENNIQPLMKLKLQLFPIDESTRRTLEKDNHNPHLELTLSTRKKISSVLEHLNRKWGSSSIASGDLTLVPYSAESSNLMSCRKWTQDSNLSAGDVYAAIGSPPVFRLRYGWFANVGGCGPLHEPLAPNADQIINVTGEEVHNLDQTECLCQPEPNLVRAAVPTLPATHGSDKPLDHNNDKVVSAGKITALAASSSDSHENVIECFNMGKQRNHVEHSDHVSLMSWQRQEMSNGAIRKQAGHMFQDNSGSRKNTGLSTLEWADSLTNISISDLLSNVSHNTEANLIDPTVSDGSKLLQQISFSCDSFDAAIAAHINKHHSRTAFQPTLVSSIWDAEETCDAFSFQKNCVTSDKAETYPENCEQAAATSPVRLGSAVEKLSEAEEPMDNHPEEEQAMSLCDPNETPDNGPAKDLSTLADIYWPDSLGPLDLDVPSCRYHSNDLILSDSLSGLNRLMANSLDAFQNCSLFGLDRREAASTTVGTQGTASFLDDKMNCDV